jgi:general secretion pathway protein K
VSRVRQRGVAMMTAIVLVALAAVLAVGIAFSSAMSARRTAGLFSVEQGLLIAEGAEAIAAFVLREDKNQQDTTAEPWTQPYGPVEIAPEVVLRAQLEDQAGKFNLNSLVDNAGLVDPVAVTQFEHLLDMLKIDARYASLFADWIDMDPSQLPQGGEDSLYSAQTPPYLTARLPVTSTSELLQLPDFGAERFRLLAPFVTALPPGTALNLCTAPAEVLDAFYSGLKGQLELQYSNNATQFKTNRTAGQGRGGACFPGKEDFKVGLSAVQQQETERRVAERSSYFRLHSWVSIGTTRFTLYSLMYRDGQNQVRPVLRTFGTE